MPRAIVCLLDSVGIGGAPDVAAYGDEGANTVGHIAEWAAAGKADRPGLRAGPLHVPNLDAMGLGAALKLSTGAVPPGLSEHPKGGRFGVGREISRGKDTPSGHWEIAGVPVPFEWGYFPRQQPAFPPDLVAEFCLLAGLPGILGDRHASGTAIIAELGEEHIRTGKPICYTSIDSVFQIAAHETHFGLERLYQVSRIAFDLTEKLRIGRVIARPFVGETADTFRRTGNRRDFAIAPPEPTLLDRNAQAGNQVFAIGKISDIYAGSGVTHKVKGTGIPQLLDRTLEAMEMADDRAFIMTNFVDFDSEYGHRRDVAGYAAALELFDSRLPELIAAMRHDDLLVLTADHGNDPTWPGTDHTREQVPILVFSPALLPGEIGIRPSFADIGESIAAWLGLGPGRHGKSFLQASGGVIR
ncbi:phosphopentomutase [Devosia honganensis]|uniref:Phosphopentomutase n=1 Tax=Devosia honganensis TaxID=1610527 RepID=A0ABV7X1N6_9HYPH